MQQHTDQFGGGLDVGRTTAEDVVDRVDPRLVAGRDRRRSGRMLFRQAAHNGPLIVFIFFFTIPTIGDS